MSPLVSIVIPTFDRPDFLKEAVASALAQTYSRIEVLVGDNGGAAWHSPFAPDPRLKYLRNARNLGMPANFNALADAAQGEFLVAIGDDDRLLPQFVERLLGAMNPGAQLAFSNHHLIDNRGTRLEARTIEHTRRYGRDQLPAGLLANAQVAAWRQSVAISATLMRTVDMQRLRFREDLNTPDTEFFIRLAGEGARFAFLPEYLAEYRVHGVTATSAGLCSERLAEYLLPVKVAPEVEPYKRQLLGPLLMNAVSRCLRRGEIERARQFVRSDYYPQSPPNGAGGNDFAEWFEHGMKSGLQHLCANLPAAIGGPAYRAFHSAKDWVLS